ncbi:hypothetical protein BXZ70DRAFT_992312 [Cristinia sonorae]|uniref:Heterokaryon incompatibility domain-containing protein n=1 Tax=Cristinia sonorae TaxID=1940300 RepID=A0A8K0UJ07_9AGAR|nr:hypothetical protein BXZ70DRAFT_992312 [Cristinia sonorae]
MHEWLPAAKVGFFHVRMSHELCVFMSLPYSSGSNSFAFRDTIWLGGVHSHDGPILSLEGYLKASRPTTSKAYVAHIQCTFTFGLLEAITESKIPETLLLNESRSMMIGTHLHSILYTWRNRIRTSGKAGAKWSDLTLQTLKTAHRLLELEVFHPRVSLLFQSEFSRNDMSDVMSTIGCIAEGLSSSRMAFPSHAPLGKEWSFLSDLFGTHRQALLGNGWCPFIVRGISGSCAVQYAMTLSPARGEVQYNHDACTHRNCVANNIDTRNYINRHCALVRCTGCASVKPPLERIIRSLQDQEVPILRVDAGQGDHSDLPVLTSTTFSAAPYIAISHVWSDGLGSTTEVGLPSCQISRISRLVEPILAQGYFWIDALCVPQRREMRKRAIGLMAETYRRAAVVLVIDSGIRSCSTSAPLAEKLVRVVTSGWMQRLWTLQEGLLAKKLMFEFSDGVLDINDLIPSGEDCFDPLLMQLASEVFRLRVYQINPEHFGLAQVTRALRWRSTSRAEDETLAICGLLNVNAFELVNLPRQERMKKLLLTVKTLPRDIPFLISPKLSEDNFRWAPLTLMTKSDTALSVSQAPLESMAECTPRGLLATYFVVYFDQITMTRDSADWIVQHQEKNFTLKVTAVPITILEDTLSVYDCNALLFVEPPGPAQLATCVGVSISPTTGETKDLFMCVHRIRLFATRIGDLELKKCTGRVVQARGLGRMRVLMV